MTDEFEAVLGRLAADRAASRLWAKDVGLFAGAPGATAEAIRHRLGWLAAPSEAAAGSAELARFAAGVRSAGLTDVVLLGMGGSSLCAEVLRDVPGPRAWEARLTVLDTTDEGAVRDATSAIVPARTLFLVASKSGSTIEVDALERHFRGVMHGAVAERAASHFIAITDPGTPLTTRGADRGFRQVFLNAADIGGRYSALSLFGLVPAALLGIDLGRLVASGLRMASRTESDALDNPGLALGAFMAVHAAAGRDKLTILLPPALQPLGAWIEQLVAESTGKHGKGVLPVVDEPVGPVREYGPDRAFVMTADANVDLAAALERAGHPVFVLEANPADLGAEFFRWEFATAIAGVALGVNPFDEPNVREAKQRTQAQLDHRRQYGEFRIAPPLERREDVLTREHGAPGGPRGGRYLAILDYRSATPGRRAAIAALRATIRERTGMATTHGVGPRYLHSTGQYHKGGPDTGLFALITESDATATSVPGADYTFSTLKHAQALGDFDALANAGRRVVHWHLDSGQSEDVIVTLLNRIHREDREGP